MYDFIQSALTAATQIIAIAGFTGIAAHALFKQYATTNAIYSEVPHVTTTPQVEPEAELETAPLTPDIPQQEAIAEDVWQTPVTSSAPRYWVRQSQSIKPTLMLMPALEVQQPSFQNYSESRLRRIAKQMQIKRYSVLSRAQLISEISKHPAAIKFA